MDPEEILEQIHKLEAEAEIAQETLDEIEENLSMLWTKLGEK